MSFCRVTQQVGGGLVLAASQEVRLFAGAPALEHIALALNGEASAPSLMDASKLDFKGLRAIGHSIDGDLLSFEFMQDGNGRARLRPEYELPHDKDDIFVDTRGKEPRVRFGEQFFMVGNGAFLLSVLPRLEPMWNQQGCISPYTNIKLDSMQHSARVTVWDMANGRYERQTFPLAANGDPLDVFQSACAIDLPF